MSKAFTKEQDGDQDDELAEEPTGSLPAGFKNYITPKGAEKLKQELHQLLHVERPELVKTVSWAASNGDRSENGDYIYGKRRLRQIDSRIRFLTKRLENSEIVDPLEQAKKITTQNSGAIKILFSATVCVEYEDGVRKTYSIVGIDESNPSKGLISWISPLGKALLGNCAGDVVSFASPRGEEELEVVSVEYREIG